MPQVWCHLTQLRYLVESRLSARLFSFQGFFFSTHVSSELRLQHLLVFAAHLANTCTVSVINALEFTVQTNHTVYNYFKKGEKVCNACVFAFKNDF